MRYKNTKVIIDREGNRVFGTTFYPTIPLQDSDKFIAVTRGQRLDTLADQYYGDQTLWWIISKANNLSGAEIQLDPSKTYRIPINISPILSEFNDLNRKR
tara:strand:+ start:40 stop:339 length:300 start_codon:yes stop_codon:yes gene_type:complete